MSRTYRTESCFREKTGHHHRSKKFEKRHASKIVRHSNVGSYGAYKKLFCSWKIADFKEYRFHTI